MGVKRGSCQENSCHCTRYKAVDDDEEGGGVCENCGHFPGNHENLGSSLPHTPADEDTKVIYVDSDPLGLLSSDGSILFLFFILLF